jgi:Lon protease-like protein
MTVQIVPLFPLGVVLFPQTRLPLHVFEPRYQALVRDCLGDGIPFGLVAIRQGSDAATSCYEVGTVAHIEKVVRLSRGRSNLIVAGGNRFRTVRQLEGRPYLRAEIEQLEEPSVPLHPAGRLATAQLQASYQCYRDSLTRMGVRIPEFSDLPREPGALSWAIGGHLVVELHAKQRLLEEPSHLARIEAEMALLRREATLLDLQLANRLVRAPTYSLN